MRKTLTDLIYEYDTRRNRSESMAEAYRTSVFEKNPELQELKSAHDEVYFDALRDTIANPANKAEIMAQAQNKAEGISAKMSEYIKAHGIDEAAMKPKRDCALCGDTGYVMQDNAKKLCPCIVRRMRTEVYGGFEIESLEGSFEKYDLAVFKSDEQRKMAEKLKDFAKKYCNGKSKAFAVFRGKSGLGKSYLMHCMAKELDSKGEDVVFIGAFNLFECFKLNRIGEMDNLSPITDAKYLFIDDLGAEPVTQNVTKEYFFNLIEERTAKGLRTVFSTNLTLKELIDRYGEKVSSRIFADKFSDNNNFVGEDIRIK